MVTNNTTMIATAVGNDADDRRMDVHAIVYPFVCVAIAAMQSVNIQNGGRQVDKATILDKFINTPQYFNYPV